MKNNLLLTLIGFITVIQLKAQNTESAIIFKELKNVVSTQPLKNIYFTNLAYQRKIIDYLDAGISAGYYRSFSQSGKEPRVESFRFDPFIKFKFKPNSKFYVLAKIIIISRYDSFGISKLTYTTYEDGFPVRSLEEDNSDVREKYVTSTGGGISLGWQWFLGQRKRFYLDLQLGLQFIEYPDRPLLIQEINVERDSNGQVINRREEEPFFLDNSLDRLFWLTLGAGSIIAPRVRIGYAF